MKQYKRLLSIYVMLLITLIATAQNGSNSPYTRYGFGQLSDQSFGNSKAMGGLAIGLRNKFQINAANPASYSAVDSLTFLFDAGMSLQNTNFNENGYKTNAKNSTVDYIAMQFRLYKGLGITAGFLPYSIVGYNMNRSSVIPNSADQYGNTTYKKETFSGEGGVQQIFVGLGYEPLKNLSIGANFSYIYGDFTHSTSTSFSNPNANISLWNEKISVSDFKLDLGLQYTKSLGEKHHVTLGAVYSFGKDVNSDAYKFTEIVGVVGRRLLMGLHFDQLHLDAPLGQLPGSFRTGKTGTNDFDCCHSLSLLFLTRLFRSCFLGGFLSCGLLLCLFLSRCFF